MGAKKVKKKVEKKISYGTFSLAVFLFPVIKRAEKVSGFVFFRKGRGKCKMNYKKKRKILFSSLGSFFDHFLSLVCWKR